MIIVLKNADFSQSNIGTLSTWRITRSLGAGATYEGPTSIDKDASFSATITIAEGYEIGTVGVTVTMGGIAINAATVDGNTVTIAISSVTGNVVIKVPTVNINTGEEDEPETPESNVLTPVSFTTKKGYYASSNNANKTYGEFTEHDLFSATTAPFAVKAGQTVVMHAALNGNVAGLLECDSTGKVVGNKEFITGKDPSAYTVDTYEYTATKDMYCLASSKTDSTTIPVSSFTINLRG